jgi:hypothetical protein
MPERAAAVTMRDFAPELFNPWTLLEEERRHRERCQRIADFALAATVRVVELTGGMGLPSDENARELVRIGRVIYDEIDHPTAAPAAKEEDPFGKPPEPQDLVEEMFNP